jgi:hypothetical protein
VQYEIVPIFELRVHALEDRLTIRHQHVGFVVIDLLVRKHVDDVRYLGGVFDADLFEDITELAYAKERSDVLQQLTQQSKVISAHVVGLMSLVE